MSSCDYKLADTLQMKNKDLYLEYDAYQAKKGVALCDKCLLQYSCDV